MNRARQIIRSSDEVIVIAPQFEEGDLSIDESQFGYESHSSSRSSGDSASSSNALVPPRAEPNPSTTEPNKWCIEGQYQIYFDAKMLNEHQKIAHIITEERQAVEDLPQGLATVNFQDTQVEDNVMYVDSGATNHLTKNKAEVLTKPPNIDGVDSHHVEPDDVLPNSTHDPKNISDGESDNFVDDSENASESQDATEVLEHNHIPVPTAQGVNMEAPIETVPEAASEVEEDEVVMTALFGDIVPPPDPSRTAGKCHRSSDHTSDADEAR
uniref:Integrase core domain containing protein n=1 Tax=Solanum tuberosum TaxID=4113 RepID=M1DJD1_SOLTU